MKERKRIEQERRKMRIFNEKHQEMSECMFAFMFTSERVRIWERERERKREGREGHFTINTGHWE